MPLEDIPDRFVVIAIGLLILFAPVVLIAMTVGLFVYTGNLVLDGMTLVVLLELYLIEIVVFAVFTYVLYRLTKVLVVHQLPASLVVNSPRPTWRASSPTAPTSASDRETTDRQGQWRDPPARTGSGWQDQVSVTVSRRGDPRRQTTAGVRPGRFAFW